ncbi:hypothetical protein [Qipengyuania qiaonensis]|uniref:DUF4189 domain-containing protein n=1 Tax=Qipengyuania qiaonensis TaxID=2867240 RepID=A0ABS7J8K5_9SPHN|nr:hypothetical protein [Qipengyuania qiaonensis]MBX7482295.1 hypothetical protein [Qipengyuania qiaonensis]
MSKPLIAIASLALAVPAIAQEPVQTQEPGDENYNMVIVYGDDECPQSTEDQIVVCARKAERERYRIPENLRFSESPENRSWAERVESFEMAGAFGAMSCSPTGAGGFTGCTQEMIKAAYADKANNAGVRFAEIIAAERAKRLATIDEDAAAEQKRVEMIEREYMERLERERGADTPEEAALPQPESDEDAL